VAGLLGQQQQENTKGWRAIWKRLSTDDNIVVAIASAAQREEQFPGTGWLLPIILEKLEEHFAEGKQFRRCAEIVKRVYRLRAPENMGMAEQLLYSLSILRSLSRVEHPVRTTLDVATAEIAQRLPQVQFTDQHSYLSAQLTNARIDIEDRFKPA
jgi:hypothetical protein